MTNCIACEVDGIPAKAKHFENGVCLCDTHYKIYKHKLKPTLEEYGSLE